MTMRLAGVLLLAAVVASCRGPAAPDEHEHHEDDHADHAGHAEHAAAPPTGGAGAANVVRIAPEMLRDLRVTTAPVEVRPAGEAVTLLGELGVDEERYAAVSVALAARVTRVFAAAGDVVAAGDILAECDSVELGRARAAYVGAAGRAELARRTLARKRGLAAERIVPQREVEAAVADVAAADAELAAARTSLEAVGAPPSGGAAASSRLVVRAPRAGTILERNARVGELVDPARPLFRIADLGQLWLTAHAAERDAVRVEAGRPARVELAALPGRELTGTVTLIGGQVDPTSRTIPVRIAVANADGILRPGMSATARVPLEEAGATIVTVPSAAPQRLQDGWSVFLPLDGEGAFERRAVGRGRDLGGEVEILSGLSAGDRVVVDGAFLLKAEAEKASGAGEHHHH